MLNTRPPDHASAEIGSVYRSDTPALLIGFAVVGGGGLTAVEALRGDGIAQ
jgi:hypothetical protein